MSAERLHKVLASAGVASRRDCEALISAGRVKVNGQVVSEPGSRVDLSQDEVLVDDQPIRPPAERVYIMLHKPAGVISTVEDPQGRKTVVELVTIATRIFPVGRLDASSEGLLLLTNDGEMTHCLTHPGFEVEKEYRALLDRAPDADAVRQWRRGVVLNGQATAPAQVEIVERAREGVWLRIVLREGRKRQIREVADILGYTVKRLIRVREGALLLGELPAGQWRHLTAEEVELLRTHVSTSIPAMAESLPAETPDGDAEEAPEASVPTSARRDTPVRPRGQPGNSQRPGTRSQAQRNDRAADQGNQREQQPSAPRYRDEDARKRERYGEWYGSRGRERLERESQRTRQRAEREQEQPVEHFQQRTVPEEGSPEQPPLEQPPTRTKPAPSRAWHEREQEKARQRKLGYRSPRDRNKR